MHRQNREATSDKTRGMGVCLFVNNSWCTMFNIKEVSRYCLPEVEYLMISCKPHYLPRVIILSWLSWSGQVTGDHNPTDYLSTPTEEERSRGLKMWGGFMTPHTPGKSQATDKFLCPVTMENQPQNIKHEIKGLWNNDFRQPQWWSWQ